VNGDAFDAPPEGDQHRRAADLRRYHFVVVRAEHRILFARPRAFGDRRDPERQPPLSDG
jgi:hypothetical protein